MSEREELAEIINTAWRNAGGDPGMYFAIAAADAILSRRPADDEWRPMWRAPKDGSPIRVRRGGAYSGEAVASWDADSEGWLTSDGTSSIGEGVAVGWKPIIPADDEGLVEMAEDAIGPFFSLNSLPGEPERWRERLSPMQRRWVNLAARAALYRAHDPALREMREALGELRAVAGSTLYITEGFPDVIARIDAVLRKYGEAP